MFSCVVEKLGRTLFFNKLSCVTGGSDWGGSGLRFMLPTQSLSKVRSSSGRMGTGAMEAEFPKCLQCMSENLVEGLDSSGDAQDPCKEPDGLHV